MEKRVWCGMRIDLAWPLQLFRFAVISCWPRGKNGGKLLLNVSSLSNLLSPLFLSMLRAQISFLEADLGKYFQYFFPRSEISFSNLSRSNSMLTNFTRSHGWILNHSFFSPPFQFKSQTRLGETFGRKDPIDGNFYSSIRFATSWKAV